MWLHARQSKVREDGSECSSDSSEEELEEEEEDDEGVCGWLSAELGGAVVAVANKHAQALHLAVDGLRPLSVGMSE